jgi:hypothetical protein
VGSLPTRQGAPRCPKPWSVRFSREIDCCSSS